MRIGEHLLLQILQDSRFLLHVDLVMFGVGYDGILRLAVRLQNPSPKTSAVEHVPPRQTTLPKSACWYVPKIDTIEHTVKGSKHLFCLPNRKTNHGKESISGAHNQSPSSGVSLYLQAQVSWLFCWAVDRMCCVRWNQLSNSPGELMAWGL